MTSRMELVSIVKTDVPASLVVFLVALPLCLGIALASGAPPVAGLLSGIIGGLVVATLGGSPMQVSGPANGLIVLVLLITQEYGLAVLGVVVLAAGTCQLAAGLLRVGQVFRAIPPAIIHGLMTGFAVIIFASQFHVMLDDQPQASALKNLLLIPEAIVNAVAAWDGAHQAASIGVLTIAILLLWKPLAPGRLASVPASLVAVGVSAAVVALGDLSVARVPLPDDLVGAIRWLEPAAIGRLREWPIIEAALVMAFLASTETLLSATAVDQLHHGPPTNYDRELAAQGIGNMVCGLVGAVPLTGVIIRSATNVAAGAQTRLSSILHGFWLLAIVALFPGLLRSVPTASLAAVLVVAVFKLINLKALQEIWQHDRREIIIYTATAATIIFWGVLPGVLLGIGLAIAKLLYTVGRLRIRCETDPVHRRAVLHLEGTATFISLPKLAAALEQVPPGTELHIHIEDLGLIDHACLDLLMQWERQHRNTGGSLTLDWERLRARFTSRVAAGRAERVCPPRTSQTAVPAVQQRRSFLRAGWQKLHDSRT